MSTKKIKQLVKLTQSQDGYGLLEIVVALTIFIILVVAGATTTIGSFSTNRLGEEQSFAKVFAQYGLDAARSIKNQGWDAPFLDVDCSSGCGIGTNGTVFDWAGSSTPLGDFTLQVTIEDVERDSGGDGDIVDSGGTDDPDTKKIISEVSWDFTPTRSNTVTLETYVTNFRKTICEWGSSSLTTTINTAGNANARAVFVLDDYLYVGVQAQGGGGNNEFFIYDVSNPAAPSLSGSVDLGEDVNSIKVIGDYAFLATTGNSSELRVIDVSNKAAPSSAATLDLGGNQNAFSIDVVGDYAYVAKAAGGGANRELYIVNVSTPTLPLLTGSYEMGSQVTGVSV